MLGQWCRHHHWLTMWAIESNDLLVASHAVCSGVGRALPARVRLCMADRITTSKRMPELAKWDERRRDALGLAWVRSDHGLARMPRGARARQYGGGAIAFDHSFQCWRQAQTCTGLGRDASRALLGAWPIVSRLRKGRRRTCQRLSSEGLRPCIGPIPDVGVMRWASRGRACGLIERPRCRLVQSSRTDVLIGSDRSSSRDVVGNLGVFSNLAYRITVSKGMPQDVPKAAFGG